MAGCIWESFYICEYWLVTFFLNVRIQLGWLVIRKMVFFFSAHQKTAHGNRPAPTEWSGFWEVKKSQVVSPSTLPQGVPPTGTSHPVLLGQRIPSQRFSASGPFQGP